MFSNSEIQRLRLETPGVLHKIHLNNAGAALVPQRVIGAINRYLQSECTIGGYETAALYKTELGGFYRSIARLVHAEPHQIAYTSSATDAYARALTAIKWEADDVVLTTTDDYVSNQIAFLQLRKRQGIRIIRAENRPSGTVDIDSITELIEQYRPKLVAVTQVPTNSGLVQPVDAIGQICKQRNVLYLVDGCQSVGQLAVDVQRMHCDFFTASFRKFLRGPRGTGFLYVADKVLEEDFCPLFLDLHSATWTGENAYEAVADAQRFELWERPYALMLGSKMAVDYAIDLGLSKIEHRVKFLADYCRSKLEQLPFLAVLDRGEEQCGIVTIHIPGWNAALFKQQLDQHNINSSITIFESARIDFGRKNVPWALRLSPHYYNTREEIDLVVSVIEKTIRKPIV